METHRPSRNAWFNKGTVMKMAPKKTDYFWIELPGLVEYAYTFCLTGQNRDSLLSLAAYNIGHIDKYFNESRRHNLNP